MTAAREEAVGLGHNYLGTEHLLLGVLHTDVGSEVLARLGLTLDDARERVVGLLGPPARQDEEKAMAETPSTPRTMDILVLAWTVSREENHIGPEHILVALLREGEGVGVRVLSDVGISEEHVRNALRTR